MRVNSDLQGDTRIGLVTFEVGAPKATMGDLGIVCCLASAYGSDARAQKVDSFRNLQRAGNEWFAGWLGVASGLVS